MLQPRTPCPIVDGNSVIFAVLAGRPDDPTYIEACDSMYKSMKKESEAAGIKTKAKTSHRRGLFSVFSCGLSYGKGQPQPSMLKIDDLYVNFIQRLVNLPSVQRIVTYASSEWYQRYLGHYPADLLVLSRLFALEPLSISLL